MNSNYGRGSSESSLNNFNFDLGLGSHKPRSLNEQRNPGSSSGYSSYSYTSSTTATTTQPKPSWQPSKPSWTHQPAAPTQSNLSGLNGPSSMVGDIFGKSWSSTGSGSGIGIVEKNPNLFGDLVSSALGQGSKGGSGNVPLKNSTPVSNTSAYSMGNLADSLPKTGSSVKTGGSWGSNQPGGYNKSSANVNANVGANGGFNVNVNNNKSANLGGPSMKSMSGGGGGGSGMKGSRDPFGSLVDFGSKPQPGNLNSAGKGSKSSTGDDAFGDFQNAAKPSTAAFASDGFGVNNDFMGSNVSSSSKMDDFGMPTKDFGSQKQTSVQTSGGGDPLDMFFTPSSGGGATASPGVGGQQFSELDDWGLDSDLGGSGVSDAGGATTELEGLPPPPAGVSASAAKNKGIDSQKQGQYADAIKWLSWAVVLLEKSGDKASTTEVLTSRASCYKEVGEYKKAVADCSKVLEHDDANISVLVQRALLYESMEKYRLGAEDLRTVLKIDPGNRIARTTIHRLNKMAD